MAPKRKIRIRVGGIVTDNGKVLLVEHTKGQDKYWLAPGGGVDFCEDMKAALAREFMEELALVVEVGDILWVSESISPEGERHILNVIFRCKRISGDIVLGTDKRLSGYAYFSREELLSQKIFPRFLKDALLADLDGLPVSIIYHGNNWDK